MSTFLKKLELQGFKSFASKDDFDFNNNAVGIVGPNGSGKSNIVDAVRWVLGERGAKNLRGEVFENLIFAGTPKKGPASIARVTMVFDNRSRELPFDAEEVAISRRLDRSGLSQFFINDQEARLADITTMLAKVRLGSRGMTIISQGQADVFVSASPKERRELIEEILGLKEFRLKKRAAERKLDRSEENIRLLRAKLEELLPHLRFLRRQKNKWEKMSEIDKELRKISDTYFSYYYPKATKDLELIEEGIKKLSKERSLKMKRVNVLQKDISKIPSNDQDSKELNSIRLEISNLDNQRSSLYKELARLEARLEMISEKKIEEDISTSYLLGLIRSFIDEFNNDSTLESAKKWVEKFSKIFNTKEGEGSKEKDLTKKEIESSKKSINDIESKIKTLHNKERSITTAQSEGNVEFRKRIEEFEDAKDDLRNVEKNIQDREIKKERALFKIKELEQKWHFLEYPLEKLKEYEQKQAPVPEDDRPSLERRMERLRSELIAAGEIDKSLLSETKETEEHYEKLSADLEDLEKASNDLKQLIRDLDNRIHKDFKSAFSEVNNSFNDHFRLMFAGGKARMFLEKNKQSSSNDETQETDDITEEVNESEVGVEITVDLPKKKIKSLEMLSGGEKSLISLAALFALISVSPPPFLVLDEVDAALDEVNSKRFSGLINKFSEKTQFIIITHNRVTMEALDALYGITMGDDGVSRVLSLKLEEAEELVSEQ